LRLWLWLQLGLGLETILDIDAPDVGGRTRGILHIPRYPTDVTVFAFDDKPYLARSFAK